MAKRTTKSGQRKQRVPPFANTSQFSRFTVKSTSADEIHRTIKLSNANKQLTTFRAQRFALVAPGDVVLADPHNPTKLSVVSTENANDLIPVTPHFSRETVIRLGAIDYQVRVREITTPGDVAEYEYLEGFHYKTSSSIVSDDNNTEKARAAGGRKAILIAYIRVGKKLLPAGYIELQMPLLMVKPRHLLFDRGFHHPTRDVAWGSSSRPTLRCFSNRRSCVDSNNDFKI